jgi:hypothetical protein
MSEARRPETATQQSTGSTHPGAPGRRRRLTRLVRIALIVAAIAAALAAAGPDALDPFRDVAGAATEVTVAFVLDFGGSTGAKVGCVKVPSGDNGYEALGAFTAEGRLADPTYNNAGLLCSINEVPTSGCGQVVSGGYVYWSYWIGTSGTWQYSSVGAQGTVSDGDVYGWKFQNPGKGNPGDPPPGVSPAQALAICATTTPTTTTTTRPTPPTTAAPVPTTVPGSSSAPGGSSAPTPSTGAGTGAAATATGHGPPAAGKHAAPCAVPTTTTTRVSNGSTTTLATAASKAKQRSTPCTPTTTAPVSGSPSPTTTRPEPIAVVAAGGTASGSGDGPDVTLPLQATESSSHGGDSALPLVVGGLLIIALFVAAALRWRRRPGTP